MKYRIEEFAAYKNGQKIYCLLYRPLDIPVPAPAVIVSHGFGCTHADVEGYADFLAASGYITCIFDFCGGGEGSLSDGDMIHMSLFTEVDDLLSVIAAVSGMPDVDPGHLFLMGTSQGGVVSAMTAAARPDCTAGLILLYPAFVMADHAREEFGCAGNIPETYDKMGRTVGRIYAETLLDLDFFSVIPSYEGDVLIVHGDADTIAPVSYSRRAAEAYRSASLVVVPEAGHRFEGDDLKMVQDRMLAFLAAHSA